MYAIVEIGGQQHKVKKAQKLYVNLLESAAGSNLEFDKVLLVDNEGDVSLGFPFLDGTRVAATVVGHVKDDKVHIFKHKRRKGYRRFNGHRQPLTEIFIQGILAKGEALKEMLEVPKKVSKFAPQVESHDEEAEVTEAPKKKAATKKAAAPKKKAESEAKAKKPAAKKSGPKKSKE